MSIIPPIPVGVLMTNICKTANARRPSFVPNPPDTHPLVVPPTRGVPPPTHWWPRDFYFSLECGWPPASGRVGKLHNLGHTPRV